MGDTEHQEWLRDEAERRRLRAHLHAVGKHQPPSDTIPKKQEGEAIGEAQEEADDAADDAADELQEVGSEETPSAEGEV